MDVVKIADQRIDELIKGYQQDDDQMSQYYIQILNFVKAHMVDFFNKYAEDNQISVQQVQQNVSQWDIQQWQTMLNEIGYNQFSEQAKKEANGISAMATFSVAAMIASIPKLGLVAVTDNNINTANKAILRDANQQVNHLSKHYQAPNQANAKVITPKQFNQNYNYDLTQQDIHQTSKYVNKRNDFIKQVRSNGNSIITDPKTVKIWSDNLWNDTRTMASQVETSVNQHIRHGMSLDDLNQMLKAHDNPTQFNPDQSLADRMKQSQFNARRIIRTESSRIVNQVNRATYHQIGVKMVKLATEPGVCDECLNLQAEGPWPVYDAPSIPDATHPNCNCYIVPDDDDSDMSEYITKQSDFN